jgi:hypothetical protein
VLLPYDNVKAHWQNDVLYWLEQVYPPPLLSPSFHHLLSNNILQGKHRNEHYATHYEAGNKKILVSTFFVFRLSSKNVEGTQHVPHVKWKVAIRGINRSSLLTRSLSLSLTLPLTHSPSHSLSLSLTLPLTHSRNWLTTKLYTDISNIVEHGGYLVFYLRSQVYDKDDNNPTEEHKVYFFSFFSSLLFSSLLFSSLLFSCPSLLMLLCR